MFLDSDDAFCDNWWEKLEEYKENDITLYNYLRKKNDVIQEILTMRNAQETLDEIKMTYILTDDVNAVCAKIYKRKLLLDFKIQFPQDMKIGEDAVFFGRALQKAKKVKYCPNAFYVYIDNLNSASYQKIVNFDDQRKLYEFKKGFIIENNMLIYEEKFYIKFLDDFISRLRQSTGSYGLYQLVYSVVSYLSLLSLGFSSSYMRFYSRYKAQRDEDGVARLNGMFLLIFTSLSIVCVLCGCVMLGNIKGIFGSGLTDSEYSTARILMALLVVNLALTFPNSVFSCAITAHEKFLFQKFLILLQNVCNPLLALPLLIMGYGSIGMVAVTTFLTLLVLVMNVYYSFHNLHIRFCFKKFQLDLLKEMWVFTFFIFINQIIDQINWSVDKFLLGRYT